MSYVKTWGQYMAKLRKLMNTFISALSPPLPSVMLLIGSGVSYEAGLGTVGTITNKVLNGSYYRGPNNTMRYFQGDDPTRNPAYANVAPTVRTFLNELKDVADQYGLEQAQINREDPSPTNYEDLYYLCTQIVEHEKGKSNNPAIGAFVDSLKDGSWTLLTDDPSDTYEPLAATAHEARLLISSVVTSLLEYSGPSPVPGYDLVAQLATSNRIGMI